MAIHHGCRWPRHPVHALWRTGTYCKGGNAAQGVHVHYQRDRHQLVGGGRAGTPTFKLKKEDSQTGSSALGNASLAGAVYELSALRARPRQRTDPTPAIWELQRVCPGTVTVKEPTAPEGYRLDTEVHTYTADGNQLTGYVYELEVDDLTEDIQRGGLTIQKQDSQTGTTPQGDASLEGIQFEIVNHSQNPVVANGNTAQPGQVAMTITTNAAGVATTGESALSLRRVHCPGDHPTTPCSRLR